MSKKAKTQKGDGWCHPSQQKFHGINYDLQLRNVDSVSLIALSVIVLWLF